MSLRKIMPKLTSFVLLGAQDRYSSAENRITIFCNVFSVFGIFAALAMHFQLSQLGFDGFYLLHFYFIAIAALVVLYLNSKGHLVSARVFGVTLINLTAWYALIFFGKTFNGYYMFFLAIVFSVVAFSSKHLMARWFTLSLSILGLPLSDYFQYYKIFPITGLDSSKFPLSILLFDTTVVSIFLVSLLLIEKFLSEKNERELTALNKNLESIVAKRTQLLDAAKEEAMAANETKSRFIANISHELRTPLGAIIGYVELIKDTNPGEKEKQQFLEVIHRSGNQLLQIVNEVLDLSKIEANKLSIDFQIFELYELINEVRTLMTLKAEDKGLALNIDILDSSPEIYLYSDPLRMKQILVNLIGNAIKFTNHGLIQVKIQIFRKTETLWSLECDISDTGTGIDPDVAKKLFQPFFQGDSTFARKYGGSGLGLALSKNLAKLLNGDLILLKSTPDVGSTFRLTLDCKPSKAPKKSIKKLGGPSLNPDEHKLKGKVILVVDDSIDNQILVNRFLTLADAKVDIAENGQVALAMIKEHPEYNAILMDLQMPILDGYSTTQTLRSQGYSTPIIAFTAHAMAEELQKVRESGFNGFISKPLRRKNLIDVLVNVIDEASP